MHTPCFTTLLLIAALTSSSVDASANAHLRVHEGSSPHLKEVTYLGQCLWSDRTEACQQGMECIEETKGSGYCIKSSPQEWDKCGGSSVNGEWSRPCPSGTYCHRYDGEYSQCLANGSNSGNNNSGSVAVWGQCGGKDYHGSTTCAEGSECVYSNDYYSQCKPKGNSDNNGNSVAVWGQCGGKDYHGSTTCAEGSHCEYNNDYYSQCKPN
jgi:hypothetical protein